MPAWFLMCCDKAKLTFFVHKPDNFIVFQICQHFPKAFRETCAKISRAAAERRQASEHGILAHRRSVVRDRGAARSRRCWGVRCRQARPSGCGRRRRCLAPGACPQSTRPSLGCPAGAPGRVPRAFRSRSRCETCPAAGHASRVSPPQHADVPCRRNIKTFFCR